MIVNPVGKPKITSALCDLICPAGKSGCFCHVMAVIWRLDEMSRNNELEIIAMMTFPALLSHENGEFQVDEQLNMSQSWPESLSSQGIMQTYQVKRGGACCLLFMIPVQLKLRKLDPVAVEKFKENIVRVNQSVPFGKMTPNASEMILPIQIL